MSKESNTYNGEKKASSINGAVKYILRVLYFNFRPEESRHIKSENNVPIGCMDIPGEYAVVVMRKSTSTKINTLP